MSQEEPAKPVRKKGGRPKSEKPRTKQVTVCFDEIEYAVFRRRVKSSGLSGSDYGRQMILKGKAEARISTEQTALLGQIAGVANNLNQLTRRAHTDGIRSIAIEASRLLTELGKILDNHAEL